MKIFDLTLDDDENHQGFSFRDRWLDFHPAPRGRLDLKVREFEGKKLVNEFDHVIEPNVVVTKARTMMARSISQDSAFNIARLQVGTFIWSGVPPISTTALGNQVWDDTYDSVVYPGAPENVQFTTIIERIPTPDINGSFITEAGLLSDDLANLFAIKAFDAVLKNSDREFVFKWTIEF